VIGDLTVHTNHHESQLVVEGANPDNLVAIGFQGADSVPRQVVGETFTNADVWLCGPRVEHLASVMPGQSGMQILLPARVLEDELAARLNRDPIDLTGQRYVLRLGEHRVRELSAIVGASFMTAQDLIASSLEFAESEALEQLQKFFVEKVLNVLLAEENELFHETPSFSGTGWILLQARSYFEENEGKPISLSDLCRALDVSSRTLQVAFANGLGVSPMRFLKTRRLHVARKLLKETSREDVSVSLAAHEAGFLDMSHFSRDYKALFGQLPSETPRL
jgi:AraC-like DNA-binding protein